MAFTSIAAEHAADLASFCIYHFLFYCILNSCAAQGHAAVLPGSYGTINTQKYIYEYINVDLCVRLSISLLYPVERL